MSLFHRDDVFSPEVVIVECRQLMSSFSICFSESEIVLHILFYAGHCWRIVVQVCLEDPSGHGHLRFGNPCIGLSELQLSTFWTWGPEQRASAARATPSSGAVVAQLMQQHFNQLRAKRTAIDGARFSFPAEPASCAVDRPRGRGSSSVRFSGVRLRRLQ